MKAKTLSILLLGCFTFSCNQLLPDNRPDLVKQKLSNKITQESKGAVTLVSFTKTNGMEQSATGIQAYELEFNANIRFEKECLKGGNAFEGYFQNFRVIFHEPKGWEAYEMSNPVKFKKDQNVQLTGKATLVKKDNGWEVENLKIKSGIF